MHRAHLLTSAHRGASRASRRSRTVRATPLNQTGETGGCRRPSVTPPQSVALAAPSASLGSCDVGCMVRSAWCVVCGVWCVVCGAWCVTVRGAFIFTLTPPSAPTHRSARFAHSSLLFSSGTISFDSHISSSSLVTSLGWSARRWLYLKTLLEVKFYKINQIFSIPLSNYNFLIIEHLPASSNL